MARMFRDRGSGTLVKENHYLGDVSDTDKLREELKTETAYSMEHAAAYSALRKSDYSIVFNRQGEIIDRIWIGDSPTPPPWENGDVVFVESQGK